MQFHAQQGFRGLIPEPEDQDRLQLPQKTPEKFQAKLHKCINGNIKEQLLCEGDRYLLALMNTNSQIGASTWLTSVEEAHTLSNADFRIALRLRMGVPEPDLPPRCSCGVYHANDPSHALNCKHRAAERTDRHEEVKTLYCKTLPETRCPCQP